MDYLFVENCRICRQLIRQASSAAQTVCRDCWLPLEEQEAEIDTCSISEFGNMKVAHAVSYEESMKLLIYKLKYDKDRLIARDLSLLLLKAYDKIKAAADSTPVVLVPIPLSGWRQMQRGFNQAELLSRHLQKKTNAAVSTKLLVRSKHTRPQHKLSKQERALNLQAAFKCLSLQALAFSQETLIILVDDIHTSGSTLAEAASVLRRSGAKNITAITIARALLG